MPDVESKPGPPAAAARAPVAATVRPCPACGKALTSGQNTACSGKCRAELSRRRRAENRQQRDQALRALLEAALNRLEDGAP